MSTSWRAAARAHYTSQYIIHRHDGRPRAPLVRAQSGGGSRLCRTYSVKTLVWFEEHGSRESALQRERLMKKWYRKWKLELIDRSNQDWRDLSVDLVR
jgi:putative endonuclease